METELDVQKQMVQVNKAILYAALLSTGGFFLANWPPDNMDLGLFGIAVWYAVLAAAILLAVRVVALLLRMERDN